MPVGSGWCCKGPLMHLVCCLKHNSVLMNWKEILIIFSVYNLEMKTIILTRSWMKFLCQKGHYIIITRKEGGGKEERKKWGNLWSGCQELVMPAAPIEFSRTCTCFTLLKNQAIRPWKAKRHQAWKMHLLSNFAYTNQNDLSKQSWRVRLITFAGLSKIFLFNRTICWKMLF